MKTTIIFDITRLLSRCLAATPRGIDRVELSYAQYCLANESIFIYQNSGVFFFLPLEDALLLVKVLCDKWQSSLTVNNLDCQSLYTKTLGRELTIVYRLQPKKLVDDLLKASIKNNQGKLVYLNVSHHGVSNYRAFIKLRELGVDRIVFYLHDTIPAQYPELVSRFSHQRQLIQLAIMAVCGDTVLVNSEYTKQCYLNFLEGADLPINSVSVIPIGLEDKFCKGSLRDVSEKNAFLKRKPYFVVVGAIEKRKNISFLLKAWRKLANILPESSTPNLLLIGKACPDEIHKINALCKSYSIEKFVHHLFGVSDDQLVDLISSSEAMLFPSLVEGWGMPVTEALSLGVPVVGSKIPAFTESGQGIAILLELKCSVWVEIILKILKDKNYQKDLIERLDNFKEFNWTDHFIQFEKFVKTNIIASSDLKLADIEKYILSVDGISAKTLFEEQKELMRTRYKRRLIKLIQKPQSFFTESRYTLSRYVGEWLA